jgi:hypothetical protein
MIRYELKSRPMGGFFWGQATNSGLHLNSDVTTGTRSAVPLA